MSDPVDSSGAQAHEFIVEHVRDITKGEEFVIESHEGVDTAFRIIFPTAYDRVIQHPPTQTTGEDK
ncbi:hypothetical protein Aph01nite_04620 [Acrocarpospora phusangensis]|uniref:Uncharacterized protein n=1 Tax=Acrocarpospora phusangensis TaxID=1070424 RepID=A0A919Q976_9ACTN|nr:hypothetical protein [Acrocarpospora phusangensis]GIH22152.1 hypothetical protein Aph01nite_04620 [Acrocarpospora phusangensis]